MSEPYRAAVHDVQHGVSECARSRLITVRQITPVVLLGKGAGRTQILRGPQLGWYVGQIPKSHAMNAGEEPAPKLRTLSCIYRAAGLIPAINRVGRFQLAALDRGTGTEVAATGIGSVFVYTCCNVYRNREEWYAEKETQNPTSPRSSRAGTVLVAGHFPAEVQTHLKVMAAEERSTVQALLGEALDLLFAERRKPQIARNHGKGANDKPCDAHVCNSVVFTSTSVTASGTTAAP